MEFKGKKGPWEIGILGNVQTEYGYFICDSDSDRFSKEENKANNALIASAPEMLEMLIYLNSFCSMKKEDRELLNQIISKATTI